MLIDAKVHFNRPAIWSGYTGNTEEQEINDSTTTTITPTLNIFKQYTQALSHSYDEV